jgi:hypothetical protein
VSIPFGPRRISYATPVGSSAWTLARARLQHIYRTVRANGGLQHRRFLHIWAGRYGLDYHEFIPNDLPDETPLRPGTQVEDLFGSDTSANYVISTGTFTISGGILQPTATELVIHHTTLMGDDTHQTDVVFSAKGAGYSGALARKTIGTTLAYVAALKLDTTNAFYCFTRDAGSYTQVGAAESDTFTAEDKYSIKCNSDTDLELHKNGAQVGADRSSTVGSGNVRFGLVSQSVDDDFNSILADDFIAGAAAVTPSGLTMAGVG